MLRPIAVLLTLACLPGQQLAAASETWTTTDVRTSVEFYPAVLQDLGIELTNVRTSADPVDQHHLSVLSRNAPAFRAAQPWSLSFETQNGHFEGLFSGAARHQGGFDLEWKGGKLSLHGFSVRPGTAPRSLEIVDREGRVVLEGTHLHWSLDKEAGRLQIFNIDLRLTKLVAARLGREALAGKAVGTLSIVASVNVPETLITEGGSPPGCNDWSGEQDVALINIGTVGQLSRSGGEVVMVPSATLKNVGTANVPWYSKFSGFYPPYNNDQHPFLTWSAFRITDEGIHQLGVSDIKHAFLTLNINCDPGACTDGHILGLGCEDVYGTGTNSNNNSLAYREEILAASGVWAHCNEPEAGTPSHFDPNGDCSSGDFSPAGENSFTHGLIVQESDLSDDTADYYFSSWYLIRDDIDIFNTMGYKKINPQFSGSSWTFGFLTTLANGSPVDAWIPKDTDESHQLNAVLGLGLGMGHLQLAVDVTDLGDGYHRYDYALMNHDFDQGVDSFSIPLPAGVSVRSHAFRDIDQNGANDWVADVAADAITWSTPDADNFLPWGVLFNFSIEADSGPTASLATLDVTGDYIPATLEIAARAPASQLLFADGFESGDTSAWSSGSP